MQHSHFGNSPKYYAFSVTYHKIPLAQLTLLASSNDAPQQPLFERWHPGLAANRDNAESVKLAA